MQTPSHLAGIALVLGLALGAPASAEQLGLEPRFEPGDAYALSLAANTRTRALSGGASGRSVEEDVRLEYRARVVVLAVDAEGRSVRERHEDVHLTYERPEGSDSLFVEDTTYEVRRKEGVTRIFRSGVRLDRRVERIVVDLLADRFEHTLEPALVDPGRPVEVGESWRLDSVLARRFLRRRGIRVIRFDGPATATLRADGGGLRLDYRIPIAWCELDEMPANTRPGHSEARFEGRIFLRPGMEATPVSRFSHLVVSLGGVRTASQVARPAPWSLESSMRWEQGTEPVVRASAGPGPAAAADR